MRALPTFPSKAFFAPMAGISDPALRLVCRELGAGLVVTELTSIHGIVAQKEMTHKEIRNFLEFSEKERPVAIQLFGSDVEMLEKAVRIVDPLFDIIDYNLGCPAPHITSQMAGAALLQDCQKTREVFRTLIAHSTKPISVKMRAGVGAPDRFLEIAKIAQEEGVSMVTLHARTLKQGYSGKADWSLIKKLKESVTMTVVGNGDIETPEDAQKMLIETGCDYVMIGRAACRNPFLFTQVNDFLVHGRYEKITSKEKLAVFFRYLEYAKMYPTISVSNLKVQAMNFTKGIIGGGMVRAKLTQIKTREELMEMLKEAEDEL